MYVHYYEYVVVHVCTCIGMMYNLTVWNTNQETQYIEREGAVSCFTMGNIKFYGGHDLYNDIHKLEVSFLAVCGHIIAKPHVPMKPLCMWILL